MKRFVAWLLIAIAAVGLSALSAFMEFHVITNIVLGVSLIKAAEGLFTTWTGEELI